MATSKLWRGLATLTAVLLIIAIGAAPIADSRANTINNWLGTSNYQTVQLGEASSDGTYFDSVYSTLSDMVEAANALAAEIASEGAVLLKNNGALPLNAAGETVTLWGLNSELPVLGGNLGSAVEPNTAAGQTAYGIKEALTERGFTLNQSMIDFYGSAALDAYRMVAYVELPWMTMNTPGHALLPSFGSAYEGPAAYNVGEAPASLYPDDVLASADGTAAVVMISRDSSEGSDYGLGMSATNPGDSFVRPLALSDYEQQVIELAKAHSEKVVVLLNTTSQMEIGSLKDDPEVDAILWVGQPGMNGFLGVADVLSGAVNPSGRLTDTYAANVNSDPSTANFGVFTYTSSSNQGGDLVASDMADWYVVYTEGVYAGYKYYETRYEDAVLNRFNAASESGSTTGSGWSYAEEMVYPFGYGLSYTGFTQTLDDLTVSVGGSGTATVTVTNTGDRAGKSVVEFYVQAPYIEGGLEKPAVQLLDFGKTGLLAPGASETLTIEFDPQYIASYDDSAEKSNGSLGAWTLDAGDYYFTIANGAHEAINNILSAKLGGDEGLVTVTPEEEIHGENVKRWTLENKDIETYSIGVENQLQDMDINKLIPGAAEYLTRSDWTRGWQAVAALTPTAEMMVGLTNSTYSLSANGEGVTWGANSGLKLIDFIQVDENGNYAGVVDINDANWDRLVEQVTLDEAMVFIENNGEGLQSIASIGYPANAFNDGPIGFIYGQVPGYYVRWAGSDGSEPTYVGENDEKGNWSMGVMPTEPVVAATWNKALVEREGEMLGEISLWGNIPCIMAPGMSVHRNPYNGRNHEYFSEDAMLSNRIGLAMTTGAAAKGLMMEVKHFAFNQMEYNRTGVSTFMTEQAARENELRSFQGPLSANTAMSIMTSFNRAGTVWAGAHKGLLTGIVRNEWGFTGWITTDMINGADYMNWKDAMSAGSSALLSNLNSWADSKWDTMTANRGLIASDTEFQRNMQWQLKFALYTTARSNALNGITSNTEIVYVTTWWQNAIRYTEYGLAVLTILFVSLGIAADVKRKKQQA